MLVRLEDLGRHGGALVPAAHAQHHGAGVVVDGDDERLDAVADRGRPLASGVGELDEGDGALALAAEVDEGGLLAEADDGALDLVAGLGPAAILATLLLLLEGVEERGEIGGVRTVVHRAEYRWRPAPVRAARR